MAAKQNPKYKGKNFKPNFVDPRAQKKTWAEQVEEDGQEQEAKPAPKPKGKGPTTKSLPGPTHKATANPTPLKDDPIYKESIFGDEICVRENNMRTTVQPNLVALLPIVNETWIQLSVDNANIGKEMLIEGFRYYSAALLWIRIIQLKRANSQPLTQEETSIMEMCETTTFNAPHPIFLYLQALGNLKCASTGQTLIPSFPPLPTEVVNQRGGYYGAIDDMTHNLYEEIPSLGVCVEGLQTSIGDAAAGNYVSAIAPANTVVNQNLLGYVPLVNRRNEAKNFFLNIGITADEFAENPVNSGFNYDLMYAVSNWIGTTKTFKVEQIHFANFQINGSQAQAIVERPVVQGILGNIRNVQGDIIATALMRDSKTTFGVAQYTLFQMMKETATNGHQIESVRAGTWSCVTFNEAHPIPNAWIENRNVRRNIPDEYNARRFETISQNNGNLRKRTILAMVTEKR